MGSACTARAAVEAGNPDEQRVQARSPEPKEDHLRARRSLIFHTEYSESSFLDLSTPRSGKCIKWRRGELIGEGAYAKVYQCISLSSRELFAVKNFVVINK